MITYIVKKGDTLSAIAKKFLGSADRYPEIMKVNGMENTIIYADKPILIPVEEPKNYEEIGKQVETCIAEIQKLDSVKRLEELLKG